MMDSVRYPVLKALFDEVSELQSEKLRAENELEKVRENYEAMRPHWAMGYTSDSMAAQASTNALSQLWEMLGVSNQSDAVDALKKLNRSEGKSS